MFDAIAAIEAAYAPAPTAKAWLHGILEALATLDTGRGLYAMTLDASNPEMIQAVPAAMFRVDLEFARRASAANARIAPATARAMYWRAPPVVVASRWLARALPGGPVTVDLVVDDQRDIVGLFAVDQDDRGVLVGIPIPRGREPAPSTVHALTRIAAHVTSARRLRDATGAPTAIDASDAVIDPSGTVRHAVGAARGLTERATLREAVRRIERARGRARRAAPAEAVELWLGLVSGRWSLVDHVDTDGRRFVLARRNEPRTREPLALRGLERHVAAYAARGHPSKYIAYLLGVPPSTVGSLLASARRKLGVRSRLELIRRYGGGDA